MSLVPTIGAVLIGNYFSAALYGLTTLQVYLYFRKRRRTDSFRLQAFIFYIWILETFHVVQLVIFLFRDLILNFGHPEALEVTKKSDDVTTAVTGLIIFSVHLFYIRRLWILSEGASYRVILVVVTTSLAITHFGLELGVMALTFKYPNFSQFRKITGAYTGSLAVAAACDILIAVAMWYLLDSRRSGVKKTNTMVDRIITFVLITGTLTSVVDIVILICFVAMPDNLVYLAIFNFINNLYVNSLLAMINARESLGKMSLGATTNFALSDLRSSDNTASVPEVRFGGRNNVSEMMFTPQKSASGLETFDSENASRV